MDAEQIKELIAKLNKYGPRVGPLHNDIRLDAADALASLLAENERLREELAAELAGNAALRSEFGAADTETFPAFVERLARDAERYRWLRRPENRVEGVPLEWDNERLCYKWDVDKVDAAIDAAMEKEKRDE